MVLDKISKSALQTLNKSEHEPADRIILSENDSLSIFVMGRILVGIYATRKVTAKLLLGFLKF